MQKEILDTNSEYHLINENSNEKLIVMNYAMVMYFASQKFRVTPSHGSDASSYCRIATQTNRLTSC